MQNSIVLVAVLSLAIVALVFGVVGFVRYRFNRLTEENSVVITGTLVAFREYRPSDQWNTYYDDYKENGKGRLPVFRIEVDGDTAVVDSLISDYDLTSDDIGKHFPLRYRQGFGISIIVNDEMSIRNYNQLQNTLFWVFESIAIIFAVLTAAAYFMLPKLFSNMIN